MNKILSGIGAFVVAVPILVCIGVLVIMWRTWWLYPAWAWYVEPLGIPPITFWHFAALSILISYFTHQNETKKDERKEDWSKWSARFANAPIIWVILWWMR